MSDMFNCKLCDANLYGLDSYTHVCNIYSGGTDFEENVILCSTCLKNLLESGYIVCDFCNECVPCIGKEELFIERWHGNHFWITEGLETACKCIVENGYVHECCCIDMIFESGDVPRTFFSPEEDLSKEELENYIDFNWYEDVAEQT